MRSGFQLLLYSTLLLSTVRPLMMAETLTGSPIQHPVLALILILILILIPILIPIPIPIPIPILILFQSDLLSSSRPSSTDVNHPVSNRRSWRLEKSSASAGTTAPM